MNVIDAALAVGLNYPGGVAALAPRIGLSIAALRAKLNPNDRREDITLAEAVSMQLLSGYHRVLFAMAAELGYVCQLVLASANNQP